ncbi:hypothetical protein DM02DRAFT_706015 [Periconia macrospinosa]|uniref:F-box domain-containing protein n=1 Tax=Periconia macrospinosa TaxID=97972 RepID=A0A2V1CZT6_9PLEO|nr:hypothetical protein DM02DRAFT_706015 [Periconia macrospinosa]
MERTVWSQRGLRKHPYALRARCAAVLTCGHRCGRPFIRTDMRDQQWYCGDHDLLLPKRQPTLLELPGEIRNEIYKHAFPPFLGLLPRDKESSMGLLEVNRQVYEEVKSLMYSTTPLRLIYEDDLSIDKHSFHWGGQYCHTSELEWSRNQSTLLQLFGRTIFKYINDIEIFVDMEDIEDAERSILLDFVDALRFKRKKPLRLLTINLFNVGSLTDKQEKVEFVRFLEVFREVPGFKDICFELQYPHQLGEDGKQILQRALEMRDSLLPERKRKFEQFQE